jgi:hypothetical protein
MNKFKKKALEFYLPDNFKGLNKEYLMECIFDKKIQQKWNPGIGDIIVGCTGNIFVISMVDELHESIGGKRYYFGGGSCNRDGGNILDSTYCYTANESGKYIHPIEGEQNNLYHSSIRDFRYVPYPHER